MPDGSFASLTENDLWHRRLAAFNAARFAPGLPHDGWEAEVEQHAALLLEEGRWLEQQRAAVAARAAEAPRDPDGFVAWFEAAGAHRARPERHAVSRGLRRRPRWRRCAGS